MYSATTLVMLFWGLYAGSLIDRFSRKHVFLGINVFGALLLGVVSAYGYLTGDVGEWGAIAVFSGTIFVYNIHYPALYAFGQEITERKFYSRFTSMAEVVGQSTSIISGAAGALMLNGTIDLQIAGFSVPELQPWKLHEIFLADGITYLVSIFLIAAIRYVPMSQRHAEDGGLFNRIKSGFTFLKSNPLIFLFGNGQFRRTVAERHRLGRKRTLAGERQRVADILNVNLLGRQQGHVTANLLKVQAGHRNPRGKLSLGHVNV
jgi:MFS family permease